MELTISQFAYNTPLSLEEEHLLILSIQSLLTQKIKLELQHMYFVSRTLGLLFSFSLWMVRFPKT